VWCTLSILLLLLQLVNNKEFVKELNAFNSIIVVTLRILNTITNKYYAYFQFYYCCYFDPVYFANTGIGSNFQFYYCCYLRTLRVSLRNSKCPFNSIIVVT